MSKTVFADGIVEVLATSTPTSRGGDHHMTDHGKPIVYGNSGEIG